MEITAITVAAPFLSLEITIYSMSILGDWLSAALFLSAPSRPPHLQPLQRSALCLNTKDPHFSDLLSQTSQNAIRSLELQLDTSRKVLELTKNVHIMTASASEASRVSSQIVEILELVSTFQSTGDSIQSISDDVKVLNLRSQGRRSNILRETKSVTEDYTRRSQKDPDS